MTAIPYSLLGVRFNATEEAIGAFTCYERGRPEASDLGPHGMVAEAENFMRIVRENDLRCLVDVGALFGFYSLLFTADRYARAYALEASDVAFPILQEQCALNPQADLDPIEWFAGDHPGRQVHCARDWKHVIANMDSRNRDSVLLTEQPIDSIQELRTALVDVMKIDVEAYECQALRGAAGLIQRCRPIMFLEVHTNNLQDNGETSESLMDILLGFGYRVQHYDGSEVTSFRDFSMTRVVCWPK